MELLTNKEIQFIESIRNEAEEVKDCYTKFSYQSWLFTVASLGIIFRLQLDQPLVGSLAVLPIILLLSVGRIGIHKYTTANRLYGFELYMNRRKRIEATENSKIKDHKSVGWEEAYYAWRITQATIYKCVYVVGKQENSYLPAWGDKVNYRSGAFNNAALLRRRWSTRVTMYPGSYLKLNFFVMYVFCAMCLGPIFFMAFQFLAIGNSKTNGGEFFTGFDTFFGIISLVLAMTSLTIVLFRQRKLDARRKVLETGLLSINSCAFLWNIVIHAHFRALNQLRDSQSGKISSFEGYTKHLVKQTEEIALILTDEIEREEDPFEKLYVWMSKEADGLVEVTR